MVVSPKDIRNGFGDDRSGPVGMSALCLSQAIVDRELACEEVMDAFLSHIARYNPSVNALVSLQDFGFLLKQSRIRDRQLASGEYMGWLHGMPFAIKDLSPVAGIPMTLGSPLFAQNIPSEDGLMPSRIRRAGAIMIGKTNTPEFGLGSQTYNRLFGATRNAYDHERTAGGSSGGAAVAVAMRMVPVADGSDMMGSLRNPAAFNNVFGMRPSLGRVPQSPTLDVFYQQLGIDGPMGRTVADVARLLATQAGADPRSPLSIVEDPRCFTNDLQSDVTGKRIGWLGNWNGYLPMEEGVLPLCESALENFTALGCHVEPVVPDFEPERLWDCWTVLRHWAVAAKLSPLCRDPVKREQLKPEAIWEVEEAERLSAMDIHDASVTRSAWFQTLRRMFDEFDFLIAPSAQIFPFDVGQHWPSSIAGVSMDSYHRWMEVTVGASLAGVPAISLPAGFSANGLPMGIQLIGPHRADRQVLQMASAYERSIPEILARQPIRDWCRTAR